MKRTFSFFTKRNALWCFVLTGMFFLVGISNSSAQDNAGGLDNPEIATAQQFNVTAYPIGTFDREEVIEVLEGIAADLKANNGHNPSITVQMKYKYISDVLQDVRAYSIAAEISLLKKLAKLKDSKILSGSNSSTTGGTPPAQFANLYNEVVNELQ
jgi:hypothetical protein